MLDQSSTNRPIKDYVPAYVAMTPAPFVNSPSLPSSPPASKSQDLQILATGSNSGVIGSKSSKQIIESTSTVEIGKLRPIPSFSRELSLKSLPSFMSTTALGQGHKFVDLHTIGCDDEAEYIFGVDIYGNVLVFNLANMQCVQTFRGHDGPVVDIYRDGISLFLFLLLFLFIY